MLKLQPRTSATSKRAGETLVSPLKKVPHLDNQSTASQYGHTDSKGKQKEADTVIVDSPSLQPMPAVSTSTSSCKPAPFPMDVSSASPKAWPRDFYVCTVVEGLDTINTKMDNDRVTQYAAFAVTFPNVKYNKTQMVNTRLILKRAGPVLRHRFVGYGQTPKGTWRAFKSVLPPTILDKFFSDDQAIRDLEELESDSSTSGDDIRSDIDDLGLDNTTQLPINLNDDDSSSDDSHAYTGERCSFCDERLDFIPSNTLLDMRMSLESQSKPDPIPGNPYHRKAKSFKVTIEYCQRHRLESDIFPTARNQGWPTDVDFSTLYGRVRTLCSDLKPLFEYDTVRDNEFFEEVMKAFAPGTSTAAASGTAGQWGTFKGHGAG
jgi:hypothetical protein